MIDIKLGFTVPDNPKRLKSTGSLEVETEPEHMEYTGPLCICGKHRTPGTPEEQEHADMVWKYEFYRFIRGLGSEIQR